MTDRGNKIILRLTNEQSNQAAGKKNMIVESNITLVKM